MKVYHIVVVSVSSVGKSGAGIMSADEVTAHLNSLASQGWIVKFSNTLGFDENAVRIYFLMEKDVK
jgi:hypothetical protein